MTHNQASLLDGTSEISVLGQETVTLTVSVRNALRIECAIQGLDEPGWII
jgi:hypothetical protein